jgi:hypothetical protein
MTATEGLAKGLELPVREELKGLEGPELEKSAMVGESGAAAAPRGGGADRVWGAAGGGGLARARVMICF